MNLGRFAQSCRMRTFLAKAALISLTLLSPAAGGVHAASILPAEETPPLLGTYQEVIDAIDQGKVREASFHEETNVVVVTMDDGTLMQSYYPPAHGPSLVVALLRNGTPIRLLPDSLLPPNVETANDGVTPNKAVDDGDTGVTGKAAIFAGVAALLGFAIFLMLQKRSAKRKEKQTKEILENSGMSTTTFADVAGCEEAIEDLKELVEFLKNSERFHKLGAKVPKGALLVGPPGTGKTLLAKAVAGEANVPFLPATGSDFVELYVGVGAKRIRELFAKANEHGKAIIFIDEIDAIGRVRSEQAHGANGAHMEQENTLMALLSELDGFRETGVVVIGATNRPDVLDPALVRPGRLERKVHVPNPDRHGREHILAVHTSDKPLDKDVDLSLVAMRTPGSSGADLAAIANEAAIEAARRNLSEITQDCFENAISTIVMGRARHSALVTERDRRITAWHEAGHALVALLEQEADNPLSVSIVPRGAAGGVTWMSATDDQFMSRNKAKAQLTVALAGRAGEELLLDGEFTQGAQSDLVTATKLAGAMVTRFGMSRRGLQVRNKYDGTMDENSEDIVDELLQEAMERARNILSVNHASLETLALGLLEYGTLTLREIRTILDGRPLEDKPKAIPVVREPLKMLQKKILNRMEDRSKGNKPQTRSTKETLTSLGKLGKKLRKKPGTNPQTA